MIEIWVRDRDDPRNTQKKPFFRKATRKGKLFQVGDAEVELFRLAVMAEALDRTPKSLAASEKAGLFPKPIYATGDGVRWYSAAQVVNCNAMFYYGFGGLKRLHVRGANGHGTYAPDMDKLRRFWLSVASVFQCKEVVASMAALKEIIDGTK